MMLTGRNEWLVIGALILWIAFVPCPYPMKQFFSSPVGKAVALGVVIYVWKYVSCPVALLLLVAFLRSGAIREYLEGETGMTPPPPPSTEQNFKCPSEFVYSGDKKTCVKGDETKSPECNDSSMTWNATQGRCVAAPPPPSGSGGPPGGTTPGSAAAMNDMANTMPPSPPTKESFTAFEETGNFAPA